MKLNVTMMGSFKKNQPPDKSLEVPDGTTIEQVLELLKIAGDQVQVVLLNGTPQGNRTHVCQEDDSLTILPIVGGG